ncbi:MAG: hypothetical protein KBD01_08730 [Acidobacteria bacterium]|nr:hypothetical protein [Acidobacteriota bacterium]
MSDRLYVPYRRLVPIRVLGRVLEVPENNVLLRCLQFVSPGTVPYGRFCWNKECGNCKCFVRRPGEEQPRRAHACSTVVEEGMEFVTLSPELKYVLRDLLK